MNRQIGVEQNKEQVYMVYLDLPVASVAKSVDFYVTKLGLFKAMGTRLICVCGPQLILDLHELEPESSGANTVQTPLQSRSFAISLSDELSEPLVLLEKLRQHQLDVSQVENLGGHRVCLVDPSGHHFAIHAPLGMIV